MEVVRDEEGGVVVSFGSWEEVVDRVYDQGLEEPEHIVSDGDRAIAWAIELVYGSKAPHQLCHFHLLREYRRDIGKKGWQEAKALLGSKSREEAEEWGARLMEATEGKAAYWCEKAKGKGLTFLRTGHERWKTTSRLERFQRKLSRRESLGSAWSPHNLEVLLAQAILATSPI